MWKRALTRLLLTLPAIWLAAYGVFRLKEYLILSRGVVLHPLLYQFMLLVACWAALQLTYGDILRELRARSRKRRDGRP